MNKPLRTYDELLQQRAILENLLETRRELIRLDIEELKASATPLFDSVNTVSRFITSNKKAGLLGIGANTLIDMLVKKVLLSGSGWLSKLVIPFFVKNYTSHFIASHQDEWMKILSGWISSSNGNGKQHTAQES